MTHRRSRLGDSGWDRFLAYEGYPWYYVVDNDIATREEQRVIKRLGYYGMAITMASVKGIARGVPWSRKQLGDASGWDRFLAYGFYTWDYVIEAGYGYPTKEEEKAILRLGYYGKKITPASVAAIAQGLPWKPAGGAAYVITMNCVDGADEESFATIEAAAKYVREYLGADRRNVRQDGFGTDYCNFHFEGFTMADLGIDISEGFGRCRC